MKMHKNRYLIISFAISFFLFNNASIYALQPQPMSYPFPIEHYDQTITDWIKPDSFLEKPLLNPATQKKQFENFKIQLLLPWNDNYIAKLLNSDLQTAEKNILRNFDKNYTCKNDQNNFICSMIPKEKQFMGRALCDVTKLNTNTPYPDSWIQALTMQVNLSQFIEKNSVQGKAIALDNTSIRILPTEDHYFHDCNLPGEGDSFDYLQISAMWAGTPIYILGESTDHHWYLVYSTDVIRLGEE